MATFIQFHLYQPTTYIMQNDHLYTIPPISTHNLYHAEWPPLYNPTAYINPQPISYRLYFIQPHSLYHTNWPPSYLTAYIIQSVHLYTTSQLISYKVSTFIQPHSLFIQIDHLHTTNITYIIVSTFIQPHSLYHSVHLHTTP